MNFSSIVAGAALSLAFAAANAQSTMCPMNYEPVCGTLDSGQKQDFTNSCFATVASAKLITPGKCSNNLRSGGWPLPWPFPWLSPEEPHKQLARVRIMPGGFE